MKKIITRAKLILLMKVVVTVVVGCSYFYILSRHSDLMHIGFGTAFGGVVLIWGATSMRSLIDWRSAVFLGASAGIYYAVYRLCSLVYSEWLLQTLGVDIAEAVIEQFENAVPPGTEPPISISGSPTPMTQLFVQVMGGILLGSVLLPVAQGVLLVARRRRVFITMGTIFSVCFIPGMALTLIYGVEACLAYLLYSAPIWQGTYLVSMFGFRKKEVEADKVGNMVSG